MLVPVKLLDAQGIMGPRNEVSMVFADFVHFLWADVKSVQQSLIVTKQLDQNNLVSNLLPYMNFSLKNVMKYC